jgi:type IV secretion system protein TrbL
MVVTHTPRTLLAYLLRSTLLFVAVFALVAGNAGIAAAQDPPPDDPSFVENAATASTCSNAVGLGVSIASDGRDRRCAELPRRGR